MPERRHVIGVLTGSCLLALALLAGAAPPPGADDTWLALAEGNARFVAGTFRVRNHAARRAEVVAGQHPQVVLLGCADSRVPPEIIFDQGIGDVFVVRSAGNIVSPVELESLEYGLVHLQAPLLVVLGHSECGAVKATIAAGSATGIPGNLGSVVEEILPVVRRIPRAGHSEQEHVAQCVDENVRTVISTILKRSRPIRDLQAHNSIKIIGARYELATGTVVPLAAPAMTGGPA